MNNEQSPYTETSGGILLLNQPAPSNATLHRTCDTLPFFNFKKCYCLNNLSFLIIEGTPTPEELSAAWNEIIFEYSTLINSDQSDHLLSLSKEILLLQHHIFYVQTAVDLLRLRHVPDIVEKLINMGYHGEYNFEDKENYNKQLDRVIALCTTNVFELGVLQDEYKRLDNTVKGKKQSEDDFDLTIAALSKHQGYRINQKETVVKEFTSIFNLYLKEIAHQNKMATNGNR